MTLYFEDFHVGQMFTLGPATIDRRRMLAFAEEFDPQPFHLDATAASSTMFGEVVASGWFTASTLMRLLVDGMLQQSAVLGATGIEELRWLRPVRADDTITAELEIRSVQPWIGREDRGTIHMATEVRNQHGAIVLSMRGSMLFRRRPPLLTGDDQHRD